LLVQEGCSNCGFSFCRKCLPHRALLPQYANKPVTVCNGCYEKLNITRIKIGADPPAQHSNVPSSSSKNWWGEGLPPPSLRQTIVTNCGRSDVPKNVLTLSEIEQRLADLRGCDVELIRRISQMFEPAEKPRPSGATVKDLMKEAQELAEIEEMYDPDKEIEVRFKRIKYDGSEKPTEHTDDAGTNPRMSTVSSATNFSEATAKELMDINKLHTRIRWSMFCKTIISSSLTTINISARQKSLELEKINNEIGLFWDKQLDKVELSDSDGEELDDETVKKIILEAEQSVADVPDEALTKKNVEPASAVASPQKKPGLFSKIFRRDGKS
uniref:FYVE-type domain-containing protein n=1 Tax=Heligmosomoides polygyrus TaxID=6339 RepID=A0A183FTH6_HELPZ